MSVLFWGIGLSAAAFFIHLGVWRIKIPLRQTRAINLIFAATLVLGLALARAGGFLGPGGTLHAGFFFLSMWAAYVITYSAFEAMSPTLVMVEEILQAGPSGLPKTRFDETMTDALLVIPRVEDLLRDAMAYMDGDRYRLTPKGKIMALIFVYYRKLLNAPMGG